MTTDTGFSIDSVPVTADDIVVGLDDTPTAHGAVSWALHAAHIAGRRVVLVRAVDPQAFGLWFTTTMLREGLTDLYRPGLERVVARARLDNPGVEVLGQVRIANPNTVMTDLAHLADQIVLGVHPRSLASRLLVGSMAHHLIRTAPCPVVLVPLAEATDGDALRSAARVVVAVGGDTGTTAVRYGFAAAARRELPLTLFHAAQPSDAASTRRAEQAVALRATIDSERRSRPAVVVHELSVDGDLDTALSDHLTPDDLLVIGHRVPARPNPPIIDRLLLPLLKRPRQTVAIVPDRLAATTGVDPSPSLGTADDLVTGLGYP